MIESDVKGKLRDVLKGTIPGAIVIRHEDKTTAGIPDVSVSRERRTIWIEVKHSKPGQTYSPTERQKLMLRRLRGLLVSSREDRSDRHSFTVSEWGAEGLHSIRTFTSYVALAEDVRRLLEEA